MTFLGIVLHKWKRHSCLALFSKTAFDKKKQKKTQLYVTLTACIQNIHILFLKCEVSFSVVTYSWHRDSLTVWQCDSVRVWRCYTDKCAHNTEMWWGPGGNLTGSSVITSPTGLGGEDGITLTLGSHLLLGPSPLTSHLSPLTSHL